MARKNPRIYTYTVTGKGSFPLDMLRYDVASPADAKSAALIKASSRRARAFFGYPEIYRYSVRLVSAYEPTLGRWESFGWEVSDVSSARTAKNNPRSTGYVAAKIRANTAHRNGLGEASVILPVTLGGRFKPPATFWQDGGIRKGHREGTLIKLRRQDMHWVLDGLDENMWGPAADWLPAAYMETGDGVRFEGVLWFGRDKGGGWSGGEVITSETHGSLGEALKYMNKRLWELGKDLPKPPYPWGKQR